MVVKATARYVGFSPQKVRRVLELIRGKKVEEALHILGFLPSPVARQVAKVVRSASANAENNFMMAMPDLTIVQAYADDGPRLKRFRAKARGRAGRILKSTSHITVVVDEVS